MENKTFCVMSIENALNRFETNPYLKTLFPNLYRQIAEQTDRETSAYAQTYKLDDDAAAELTRLEDGDFTVQEEECSYDFKSPCKTETIRDRKTG